MNLYGNALGVYAPTAAQSGLVNSHERVIDEQLASIEGRLGWQVFSVPTEPPLSVADLYARPIARDYELGSVPYCASYLAPSVELH